MKETILYLLLASTLFISCSKSDTSSDCKAITLAEDSEPNLALAVSELSILGDELKVKVGFSGCDDEKPLTLTWDGSVNESPPPMIALNLFDGELQDACLAFFTAEQCFDISALKTALNGEESVIIRINNQESIVFEL